MLQIVTIPVTSYRQNSRLLIDPESGHVVCVDPGGDIDTILSKLPPNLKITAIWITHSHIDHVSGVNHLLQESPAGISVISHRDDAINRQPLPMLSKGVDFPYSGDFEVTDFCEHDQILFIGQYAFRVIYTPGHAIGHVSFFLESDQNSKNAPLLIAGDALFKGSIGRTDLPGGNHDQLCDSIVNHLFVLPARTVVCSGHGDDTTIGDEIKTNPFFQHL